MPRRYPVNLYAKDIFRLLMDSDLKKVFDIFYEIFTSGSDASYRIAETFILKDPDLSEDTDLVRKYRNSKSLTDRGEEVALRVAAILEEKAEEIEKVMGLKGYTYETSWKR